MEKPDSFCAMVVSLVRTVEESTYMRYQVIFDEDYHDKALDWVRSHCSEKGKPNVTW